MKISQTRQLDRFKRSLKFIDDHAKDFDSGSKALQARDQLKEVIARAESNAPESTETKPGRRVYNSDKLTALNALRAQLGRISRTASLIQGQDESFNNTFEMPDKRRKDELAKAARHFIEEMPKVSDKFATFELKDDEVEKLKTALENYEEVQAAPAAKPARSPRTASSSNPVIAEGIDLVDQLDIMMHNKYDGQTDFIKSWNDVSKLEVTRRKRKGKGEDDSE